MLLDTFEKTIGVTDNALSPKFCNKIIDFFEICSDKGITMDGHTHRGINNDIKDTTEIDLMKIENNPFVQTIMNISDKLIYRYVDKFGYKEMFDPHEIFYSQENGTHYPMWEVHKYEKGKGHYNAWHTEGTYIHEYSNRLFVSMFYLNDVEEGGRTVFPYSHRGVVPKQGTHVVFPPHWPWVHYAEEPISDDKYILTSWLCASWKDFKHRGHLKKQK